MYFNKKDKIIKYAGAETPIFIIQNDELKIIKTNRHSVGYRTSDKNFEYTEHIFDVSQPTSIYISTDGYLDQKGGKKGFPYGKKKFMNSIKENYHLPMEQQKEGLIKIMEKYQNNYFTVDDNTIVALKIN